MTSLGTVNVGTDRTVLQVACGFYHTCALLDNFSVKCWGRGNMGQLGSDNTTKIGTAAGQMAALQPVNLGLDRTAKFVAAGNERTCVILDNDRVTCWGNNGQGTLGQDSTANLGDGAGKMAALGPIVL
jgi:alpha-tubulin suppressor-like RCC1 family protein